MAKEKTKIEKSASLVFKTPPAELIGLRIVGSTPLLFNKTEDSVLEELLHKQSGIGSSADVAPKTKKRGLTERDVAAAKLHAGSDIDRGIFTFPTASLHKSLLASLSITKQLATKRKSFNAGLILYGVNPNTEEHDPENFWIRGDFQVDKRLAIKSDANKSTAIAVVRPKLYNWSFDVVIDYNPEAFTDEQVVTLLALAGKSTGIGSFRKERGGSFGSFKVATSGFKRFV